MSDRKGSSEQSAKPQRRPRRRKRDIGLELYLNDPRPWWKEVLFGLLFLIPAGFAIAVGVNGSFSVFGSLRSGAPVIDTASDTFGIVPVGLSMAGIGAMILLGATRLPWAYRHAGTMFGGVCAFLLLGIALMMTGSLVNGMLMRNHGYEVCDQKSYFRMTTTLWASADRGCDGVGYRTLDPL